VENSVTTFLSITADRGGDAASDETELGQPQSSGVKKLVLIGRSKMLLECFEHMLLARARDFAIESVPGVIPANIERPDLVLLMLDVAAEFSDLRDYFAYVQKRFYDVPLVAIAHEDSIPIVVDAMRCGLRGYILTSIASVTVIAAIRLVLAGGTFLPCECLGFSATAASIAEKSRKRKVEEKAELTEREQEILKQLKQGQPNKIIAYQLKISTNTVKAHMRNIMRKLHATNRNQLALHVLRSIAEIDQRVT
jgi:DNA-binding NarL/FixJ family response regulator